MKRFLFTTLLSNDLGLLTRTLPVAEELARRGHKVAFCNPARSPSKAIEEAGIENLPLKHPLLYLSMSGKPDLRNFIGLVKSGQMKKDFGGIGNFWRRYWRSVPKEFAPSTSEVWDLDHFWALAGTLNENFLRCTCDAFMNVMKGYDVDVVVDSWNLWAGISARALGKPLATLIQADMHPESRGFLWWKERPASIPTPVPIVNRLLERFGLASVRTTAEFNLGDLTLVMGTPETDPLPDDVNASYVGAILWQKHDEGLPDWIDALSKDKPIVWVYSANPQYDPASSWADSDVVLTASMEALADQNMHIVLSSGGHSLSKTFFPLPENFRYEPFLPGIAMAERCHLMIHHGGFGSCQTGFHTGTPAVVIPTYSERESNARRLAAVGAGEFVLPAPYSAGDKNTLMHSIRPRLRRILRQTRMRDGLVDELRATVGKILSDATYTENADRIRAKMSEYGGATAAADLIEDLAS
jgi:UDP:flavonoid glycosyltransferase YjiC (YdhE family)